MVFNHINKDIISVFVSLQTLSEAISRFIRRENLERIPALEDNPIRAQIIEAFFDKRLAPRQGLDLTFHTLPFLFCGGMNYFSQNVILQLE